jgi:hypothetical protein
MSAPGPNVERHHAYSLLVVRCPACGRPEGHLLRRHPDRAVPLAAASLKVHRLCQQLALPGAVTTLPGKAHTLLE